MRQNLIWHQQKKAGSGPTSWVAKLQSTILNGYSWVRLVNTAKWGAFWWEFIMKTGSHIDKEFKLNCVNFPIKVYLVQIQKPLIYPVVVNSLLVHSKMLPSLYLCGMKNMHFHLIYLVQRWVLTNITYFSRTTPQDWSSDIKKNYMPHLLKTDL